MLREFILTYWPYLLVGSILLGFGLQVRSAYKLEIRRKR